MKASKKGAPGAAGGRAEVAARSRRSNGGSLSKLGDPRAPPRRLLQEGARRGVRGALGLQARGDRPQAAAAARRATGCSTSAAGPGRGCSTRSTVVGPHGAVVGIDRDPAAPADRRARASCCGDIFTTPRRRAAGDAGGVRRRAVGHGAQHDRHRARPTRRARRRCSRRRWRAPSGCWRPGGAFVGKIFQGPDVDGHPQADGGALLRGAHAQARELARAEHRDLPGGQGLRLRSRPRAASLATDRSQRDRDVAFSRDDGGTLPAAARRARHATRRGRLRTTARPCAGLTPGDGRRRDIGRAAARPAVGAAPRHGVFGAGARQRRPSPPASLRRGATAARSACGGGTGHRQRGGRRGGSAAPAAVSGGSTRQPAEPSAAGPGRPRWPPDSPPRAARPVDGRPRSCT